jgi:alcohol dehydrogenase class IV
VKPFHWIDGERTIAFGRGRLADARGLLGNGGYLLLTTPRAAKAAPDLVAQAEAVHQVGPGRVDELAAGLRGPVEATSTGLLVALGGGRVIDTAKALAAAGPQGSRRVAAIPTTLSGAEMTAIHRQAAGLPMESTPRVRPAIVVNDPALSASQPLAELAQSAGNALGHAFEGPLTPLRNPIATSAARSAIGLISQAFSTDGLAPDDQEAREQLALGALLAGYVIGSTAYGLHHVLSQTLVRFAGVGHGAANTIILPHSLAALRRRFPAELSATQAELGLELNELARRIGSLSGTTRLREVIADEAVLELCAEQAAARPDLAMTGPAAARDELLELYRAAW